MVPATVQRKREAFYIMDRDKEVIQLTLVDLLQYSNVVRNWDINHNIPSQQSSYPNIALSLWVLPSKLLKCIDACVIPFFRVVSANLATADKLQTG